MHNLFIKVLIAHFSIYYKLPDKIRWRHQRDISLLPFDIHIQPFLFLSLRERWPRLYFGHKIVGSAMVLCEL